MRGKRMRMWEWDKRIREWELRVGSWKDGKMGKWVNGRRGGRLKKIKSHTPSSISKLFLDNSTYVHTHTQMNFKDIM